MNHVDLRLEPIQEHSEPLSDELNALEGTFVACSRAEEMDELYW